MNFKNITAKAPRKSEIVENFDVLKTSGELNYGISFSEGDVILFPAGWDEVSSRVSEMKNGNKAYYALVGFNDEQKYIPIGSFRRRPVDHEEVLATATVNKEIIALDHDYDRLEHLFGKSLRVKEVVDGKFPIFKDGSLLFVDGVQQFKTQKLPVFEYVQ